MDKVLQSKIKTMTLPKWIEDKKATINMKCDDCVSFKYAITPALHPVEKKANVVSKVLEEQSGSLDWSSLVVPDFEKNNRIGINLIGLLGDKIVALKVAGRTYWKVVTLFFYEDRYYVVKNISRLWSSQINKGRNSRVFCNRCLLSFRSTIGFDKHTAACYPLQYLPEWTGINKSMNTTRKMDHFEIAERST
jgi:hypothetical protein